MAEVKVYTTPTCPWCQRAKQFLQKNNIPFQELNVAADRQARDEMVKKTGQLAVPTIVVDGEAIVGFDEPKLKEKLGIAS